MINLLRRKYDEVNYLFQNYQSKIETDELQVLDEFQLFDVTKREGIKKILQDLINEKQSRAQYFIANFCGDRKASILKLDKINCPDKSERGLIDSCQSETSLK